jgi:hypothetical protein
MVTGTKKREILRADLLQTNDKKKSKDGAKSKRMRLDAESIEFKKNWEEAQSLLQSPPNVLPSIVTIEGYDFEEYEVTFHMLRIFGHFHQITIFLLSLFCFFFFCAQILK